MLAAAKSRALFSVSLLLALSLTALAHAQGLGKIEGVVRDSKGSILAGAKVYLEAGLDGAVTATESDGTGAFTFADVAPGTVGVFAYAPGRAIDGRSVKVALDAVLKVDIDLPEPGILSGVVQDGRSKPVAGARITRVLIRGDSMVGIPIAKLAGQGLPDVQTDDKGQFSMSFLPQGVEVSPKVVHAQFAQEAPLLRVGDRAARVTLTPGVLVSGNVLARGGQQSVPNATLQFVNAQPPNDTVLVRSQGDGSYAVRLKPGPWYYQAYGPSFKSSSAMRMIITGESPNQRVTLQVAGTAKLRGAVKDAKSSAPVPGARVELLAAGAPASVATTGPTGAFELTATEGEATVRLVSVPGYLLPPTPGLTMTVEAGNNFDVPTYWVARLPRYSLEVIDAEKKPVAGAIVRVLRPEQIGWYATNADGLVDLSFGTLPPDGTVVGMVEHPMRPEGALFAITRERSTDAIVQLLPLTSLDAIVTNEKRSELAGILVEARTTLQGMNDAITIWRAYSGRNGAVHWPAVVPKTQIALLATSAQSGDAPSVSTASEPILPESGAVANAGTIPLPKAPAGRSALGKKYAWAKLPVICGALPAKADGLPAVLVHVPSAQAGMMADALAQAKRILNRDDIVFAVVSASDVPCGDAAVPILRGEAPASAYTYVVDANGNVVLECAGLPPVSVLSGLAPRS